MNNEIKQLGASFLVMLILVGCSQESEEVRIGINPWPGYDFLYLAEQKGFYKEQGLNVRIVQYSSLADTQRAFAQGQIDGMGSTLIELVQVCQELEKNGKVILVSDYSLGADVIVASKDIKSVQELKGKTIGLEINSLGIFMLARALDLASLSLDDVKLFNVEQLNLEEALASNQIQAAVTYPPASVALLAKDDIHAIFTSAEIPEEVVDVVSLDAQVLERQPDFADRFHKVWDRTLTYCETSPHDAYDIMARRENISVEALMDALKEIRLLKANEQEALMEKDGKLDNTIDLTEQALQRVGLLKKGIRPHDYIYRGP